MVTLSREGFKMWVEIMWMDKDGRTRVATATTNEDFEDMKQYIYNVDGIIIDIKYFKEEY